MATRQVPTLPQQYQTGVSGKSQAHRRSWASVFAGVVWAVYRDGHQAHGEETRRGSDTENDTGNAGPSEQAVTSVIRRDRAQYRFY